MNTDSLKEHLMIEMVHHHNDKFSLIIVIEKGLLCDICHIINIKQIINLASVRGL